LLLNIFDQSLKGSAFSTKRRESTARSQHNAEIDDIVGACDHVEKLGILNDVQFVASKLDRVPKCGPEELSLYSLGDRQNVLDIHLSTLQ